MARQVTCTPRDGGFLLAFNAMASPCEVLIDSEDSALALRVGYTVANEAWRIEDKYSRYNIDSICSVINTQAGQVTPIDEETYLLLQFAQQCFELSQGLFDVTSGVLRKAWHFDGSDNIPTQAEINQLLPFIGFDKVLFDRQTIQMKAHMEIDLGGIGKEYAVDKAMLLATQITTAPLLINFGGDLAVNGPRQQHQPWVVGVEHPSFQVADTQACQPIIVKISHGAIATSGDAKRFLQAGKKRYGHVLNVKTGWPVERSPRSVTIAAPQCTQAGLLATLALLQGEHAETYLTQAGIKHWLIK